jgi:hypothetical protein
MCHLRGGEVIDDDPGFRLELLVKTVRDDSGRGFIDDTNDCRPAIVPTYFVAWR